MERLGKVGSVVPFTEPCFDKDVNVAIRVLRGLGFLIVAHKGVQRLSQGFSATGVCLTAVGIFGLAGEVFFGIRRCLQLRGEEGVREGRGLVPSMDPVSAAKDERPLVQQIEDNPGFRDTEFTTERSSEEPTKPSPAEKLLGDREVRERSGFSTGLSFFLFPRKLSEKDGDGSKGKLLDGNTYKPYVMAVMMGVRREVENGWIRQFNDPDNGFSVSKDYCLIDFYVNKATSQIQVFWGVKENRPVFDSLAQFIKEISSLAKFDIKPSHSR